MISKAITIYFNDCFFYLWRDKILAQNPNFAFQRFSSIFRYSGDNHSLKYIQDSLKLHGYSRSISFIYQEIKFKGKKRQAIQNNEKYQYQRPRTVLTSSVLNTIRRKFSSENPQTYDKASEQLNIHRTTINRAVTKVIKMKKVKKQKVQYLTSMDIQNWKRNARKLYERVLSGKHGNYVVSLDEAWIEKKYGDAIREHDYVIYGKIEMKKLH